MPTNKLNIFTGKYLQDFNPTEPMFWRLKLKYACFKELETLISDSSHEEIMGSPVAALCYLAEWYKWRYAPTRTWVTRHFNPTGEEIKSLLTSSGIDITKWVAVNPETGRHSWIYSVYVLGGLPVSHELSRRVDNSFLRRLCRMYHGEAVIEELDDNGRAEAFRTSLKPGGSLYYFIQDITSGNPPFAKQDIKDGLSPASQLIQRIIDANNEVLRDKFRLEWLVSAPEGAEYFSRRICLNLLPEITGEGLHQYLMYDRVSMWGFDNPASLGWLEFGMRFIHKGKEVGVLPPFFSYTNNYSADRGFLSVGVDKAVIIRDIPVVAFDKIEIYAVADTGEQHIAQRFDVDSAMQLYATDIPGEWSSATMPQRATAVLWKAPWHNNSLIAEGLNEYRSFRSRKFGEGKIRYNLTLVPESLTLVNQNGDEITFYDHQGSDILASRRHDNLFRYTQGDKVRYIYEDEEGMEDEILLPLLMTRDDVIIRRVVTDEFDNTSEEIVAPELIEFKVGPRYEEWTDEVFPTSDRIKVRCTIRGRQLIKEFAFTDGEVRRDLEKEEIILPGKGLVFNQDHHFWYSSPFDPTVEVWIGNIRLEVWQPLNCKEINRGDRCYMRSREDRISVPVIAAHELWVSIFNDEGYRSYACLPLLSVFSHLEMVDKIGKLMNGSAVKAQTLDQTAPSQLDVVFAYPVSDEVKDKAKWCEWDYMSDNEPKEVEFNATLSHNTLIFQDCRELSSPLCVYCPRRNVFAFKMKSMLEKTSLLECFKVASKYKNYFFLFSPLERMTKEQFQNEIYQPLMTEYFGSIPSEIKNELTRAAIELGFITIQDEIQ